MWRAPCCRTARGRAAGSCVCPDRRDRSLTGQGTSSARGVVATCAGERDRDASWGGFVDGFQGPTAHRPKDSDELEGSETDNEGESDVIFLGTGTSEGVPRVSCLTNPDVNCPVCWAAVQPGNKNRRRNTSLLIRYAHPDGRRRHIVIDAGKFFYHSALQWFPYFGVRELDAVIITHSHADAIGGLDDLRDWTNNVQESIEVYTSQRDLEVMKKTHYYIVDSSSIVKGTAVSEIEFRIISEMEPFFVHGLQVIPLPVWHGAGYKSLGFRVGNLCYISDVSEIPADTYRLLENCEVLVLDALRPKKSSTSHFALPQALEETRKIGAKKTLFTGMMHLMDHDKVNAELRLLLESEGLDVQLSYDGLRIPLPLGVKNPQLAFTNDSSPRYC